MSCACLSHLNAGLGIHNYLIKCGFGSWVGIGNSLISMYVKFGRVEDAYQVSEEMPMRDEDMFNSLVCKFGSKGFYEEVVVAFERMLKLCILPHLDTVCHAIMACGELRSMGKGLLVHDFVVKNGFDMHIPVANSLISMHIKMGRLDLGRRVFDEMHDRDVVSWNSLITGYAQNGNWVDAFDIFLAMKKDGDLVPNQVTLLGLLSACGQAGNLSLGKNIHGHLICTGLLCDFRLGTATVNMYAKCNRVEYARAIFEEDLLEKTLVLWNSLIAGYSQNGYDLEAIILFERMMVESNASPDSVTFANVIPSYSSLANTTIIQSIHALIVKKGLDMDRDVVLGTAMVDAYGKCSDIKSAESLFTCIQRPNTATWNTMVAAYNLQHRSDQAMLLFLEMLRSNVLPDSITMVMLFQSCGDLGLLKEGSMHHGYCVSKGFSSYLNVENAIIDMYMRCGCVKSSEFLFNLMSLKNIVTWNTILFGYVKNEHSAMAVIVFRKMQSESQYKPDSVTMISFVQASAAVLAGHGGEIAHAYIIKLGLDFETQVMNSLVDAYAKNGLIENAKVLFMQMGKLRDQSSWNVMITGCGINGQGREACDLLSKMEEDGCRPDSITFTSLLSSCSHSGLIEEGCRFFHMMVTEYKIQPGLEHWTCIIDMFGRAGRLEEAYRLIKTGLHQNSDSSDSLDFDAVWGALLSACRMNMNVELGELAGEKLSTLAPDNSGYHMLLSNLYASIKRWDEAAKVRRIFEDGKLLKKPGLSTVKL
ncbi:pentatricopeptide repeat-containing protein At1g11290, chloroplastic-like [Cornus florida]|uniref:pentatricopeptide repeat-containing protein At1g11290, chloroplastic-like n=1 Tax=Cornus florida TaxID=4283 RepID=UPI00289FDDE4|nr:pentatricopeptide repeat-containing protein At1g11290, chloroplastic-like [Cornus florida]